MVLYRKVSNLRGLKRVVFSELLFLYIFFSGCLLFCLLFRGIRAQNTVLLLFSLLFYAWGEPKYLLLLIGVALVDYLCALAVGKSRTKGGKRLFMLLACVSTLGALAVFKYTGFVAATLQSLFGIPEIIPQIALPIGISFYTFQALTYVIDVYRGEVAPQRNFFYVLLYVSLFHQCVAGPIVRYQDVANEIVMRKVNRSDIGSGITRFATGLAKKAMLANVCGKIADAALLSDATLANPDLLAENQAKLAAQPAAMLWLGVIAYMLQIYLDFSAYSDMAIGMGKMVGFHYKENFNYPYTARSVQDFWRRWHMSLSTFFRDYVYIPLGGNRKGLGRTLLNMLVVWGLTGLWHGASWNFVLWGLYYFVFLAVERLFLGKLLAKIPAFIGRIYTLIIVLFGWILFRFKDMSVCLTVAGGLFGLNGNAWGGFEAAQMWAQYALFLPLAILAVTPLVTKIRAWLEKRCLSSGLAMSALSTAQVVFPPLLLLLSTMTLVGDSYNPFLYFQF